MLVKRGNVHSYVLSATPEEYEIFRKALTFPVPGHWFSKAYRSNQWDGMKRFYWGNKFPTGLLHLVEQDIDVHIRERHRRGDIVFDPTILNTKFLTGKYFFQADVVKQALLSQRGIWHLATNAGKTVCAAALVKHLDVPTLFITHQQDLMYQTHKVFVKEIGGSIGLLGDSIEDIHRFTIGMPQTMVNRLKKKWFKDYLSEVKCVLADECHLANSKTWVEVLKNCTGASYRFGLSGTPLERGLIENITLMAYTGQVIVKVSNEDLINWGVSAKPIIHIFPVGGFQEDGLDYQQAYTKGIVDNTERNAMIVEIVSKHFYKKDNIVVLVKRIDHGKKLEKMLEAGKIPVVFCHGTSSTEKRQTEVEEFKQSGSKVLILSVIGETGLDIPNMDVMVRAGGGDSTVSTLQGIGRLLRNDGDTQRTVHLYDFYDSGNKYLADHSKHRLEDYERETFRIEKHGSGLDSSI